MTTMATDEKIPNGPAYVERLLNLPSLLQKKSQMVSNIKDTIQPRLIDNIKSLLS